MSRVKEGGLSLTYDIPRELHKELRFLAVDHDMGVMKYEVMKYENVNLASDLIQEVDRLKRVEERCQVLLKKLFLKQLKPCEQDIFTLVLGSHFIIKRQDILFKEESTNKN